jgi:hypothetical protein
MDNNIALLQLEKLLDAVRWTLHHFSDDHQRSVWMHTQQRCINVRHVKNILDPLCEKTMLGLTSIRRYIMSQFIILKTELK